MSLQRSSGKQSRAEQSVRPPPWARVTQEKDENMAKLTYWSVNWTGIAGIVRKKIILLLLYLCSLIYQSTDSGKPINMFFSIQLSFLACFLSVNLRG